MTLSLVLIMNMGLVLYDDILLLPFSMYHNEESKAVEETWSSVVA